MIYTLTDKYNSILYRDIANQMQETLSNGFTFKLTKRMVNQPKFYSLSIPHNSENSLESILMNTFEYSTGSHNERKFLDVRAPRCSGKTNALVKLAMFHLDNFTKTTVVFCSRYQFRDKDVIRDMAVRLGGGDQIKRVMEYVESGRLKIMKPEDIGGGALIGTTNSHLVLLDEYCMEEVIGAQGPNTLALDCLLHMDVDVICAYTHILLKRGLKKQ